MDTIASRIALVLFILLLGAALWIQSARHNAAQLSDQVAQYKSATDSLANSLGESDAERKRQEAASVAALTRVEEGQQKLLNVEQQLQRLRNQHETLRAYLDSGIPLGIERVLWPPADQISGDSGNATGLSAEGDAEAAAPGGIRHQDGWQYCKAVEVALDNCNGDKAALRAWKEGK